MCKAGKPDLFPGFIMNIYLFTNARVSMYIRRRQRDEEFAAFIYAHTQIFYGGMRRKKNTLNKGKTIFSRIIHACVYIFVRICTACC